MKSKLRASVLCVIAPLTLALLAGCTPTVALQPTADATNPGCAEIIVRLPTSVASQAIRQTDAQATGAWGNPTSVILRCGVTPPGPSTQVCNNVAGIDWLRDATKAPIYVFTTYGRTPATQVIVDSSLTDGQGTIILDELSNAIGTIPQDRKCVSSEDVLGGTGLQSPTPGTSEAPTPGPSVSVAPAP